MKIFYLTLGILSLAWSLSSLLSRILSSRHIRMSLQRSASNYFPRVGLVVPCRGIDPGFEENIKAVLQQDYPDYHVVFVTGSSDDPAYPVLKKILKESYQPS